MSKDESSGDATCPTCRRKCLRMKVRGMVLVPRAGGSSRDVNHHDWENGGQLDDNIWICLAVIVIDSSSTSLLAL